MLETLVFKSQTQCKLKQIREHNECHYRWQHRILNNSPHDVSDPRNSTNTNIRSARCKKQRKYGEISETYLI